MNPNRLLRLTLLLVLVGATAAPVFASSRTPLRNICRVKGQEENTLNGFGLVIGLNGTGEADNLPTQRQLARAMELLGAPVSTNGQLDAAALEQLKDVNNVALVAVTATVPATGARRGDKLDCHVMAVNGSSLIGGRLAFAALRGPNTQDPRIFATCQGALRVEDTDQPTVARIHGGAQMQQDVFTPFYSDDGFVTLVLDANHADFQIAEQIVDKLRSKLADQYTGETDLQRLIYAIDATNIRIRVPQAYYTDPVPFASQLMETEIYFAEPEARVVIHQASGNIAISGDVTIGAVVVTHRNLLIETPNPVRFAKIDPSGGNEPRLEALVQSLKDLSVPADDVIEIIRSIHRLGRLHAKLIIE